MKKRSEKVGIKAPWHKTRHNNKWGKKQEDQNKLVQASTPNSFFYTVFLRLAFCCSEHSIMDVGFSGAQLARELWQVAIEAPYHHRS